jgi:PAT family beta-lactamase induction signal transducer AmpG
MNKKNLIHILTDYKQLQIFILGAFSGMPLFIIYSTIAAWLKDADIDIAIITSFAATRIFYSLKFLWSPLIDQVRVPFIWHIGHRKSWMCLMFVMILSIIFCYSLLDPAKSIGYIYLLTILLGFFSATLDIVIDAFRIDIIEKDRLSVAAANAVLGYRIGGMVASAGAFYIAADYGWRYAFSVISFLYIVGILFIFTLKEPKIERKNFSFFNLKSWKIATIEPFVDFFKRDYSFIILSAVIFYKLGDAMLGVVAMPFYKELGFTLKEIAGIIKIFGLAATITGSYIGGLIMYRYGNIKGLIFCGVAQSITNLAFIWLNHKGHDTNALIIAITIENVASGMGDAALVGYLSYLCNKQFSATQYALLSSASGLCSHSIVGFGGSLVKVIGWDYYFLMTVLLALPGIILFLYLKEKTNNPDKKNTI